MTLAERVNARLTTTANVLVIDIERLPGVAYVWEPKTRYVAPRNFIEWPSLLCFAARWYGQKRPIFEAAWTDPDRMVQRAWELYDKADAVITYNGVRFDDKHLRTEWLEAGMSPPRPWKSIDLFQQVKRFGFESKSLDSVTRRLGRPGKELHYDIGLAQAAMQGDRDAQRQMRTYNIGDIELTEWLADRLRGWMHNHPILGAHDDKACNQCGSTDLTKQPTNYRAVVIDYALYRCDNCGANVRGAWHSRSAATQGVQ
jgi:hypothetical protein